MARRESCWLYWRVSVITTEVYWRVSVVNTHVWHDAGATAVVLGSFWVLGSFLR